MQAKLLIEWILCPIYTILHCAKAVFYCSACDNLDLAHRISYSSRKMVSKSWFLGFRNVYVTMPLQISPEELNWRIFSHLDSFWGTDSNTYGIEIFAVFSLSG